MAAFALAVLLVLPSGDRLHITPALDVSSEHAFSLVQWHITNFFGKWAHLLREAIPGQRPTREERIAIVGNLDLIGHEVGEAIFDIRRLVSASVQSHMY